MGTETNLEKNWYTNYPRPLHIKSKSTSWKMGQPDEYNLHRGMLKMVLPKLLFFWHWKLPPSSLFIVAPRSHQRSVLVLPRQWNWGSKFDFKIFFKLKINSKCGISIFIADVESIFKVLFKN